MFNFDIDWQVIWIHLVLMTIAYVLAIPIGWDREREAPGAGLRTFPLVATGSCGYILLGLEVLDGSSAHARILYGLITGIGFIGGGAILKDKSGISGTATAASIWITGAVGAAVAWQRFEIAIILSALNFMTLKFIRPLKSVIDHDHSDKSQDSDKRPDD